MPTKCLAVHAAMGSSLPSGLGFWVKLDEAYVTYHQSYIESVWWSLKNLFDRGLLYQGHKIIWWWAQGGTALSSGEVGQGYKTVMDPSVYVLFPLLDREEYQPAGLDHDAPGRCPATSLPRSTRNRIRHGLRRRAGPAFDLCKELVDVISARKSNASWKVISTLPGLGTGRLALSAAV